MKFNPPNIWIKKSKTDEKLDYYYKNKERIMKRIYDKMQKHNDAIEDLEKIENWQKKSLSEKKKLVKKVFPYLSDEEINFLGSIPEIDKKYNVTAENWDTNKYE